MHGAVLHGAWLVRTAGMWTRDVLVNVLQNDGRADAHGCDGHGPQEDHLRSERQCHPARQASANLHHYQFKSTRPLSVK